MLTTAQIRTGLATLGKKGFPVKWPDDLKFMPPLFIRRWPLPLYHKVTELLRTTEPIRSMQIECLVHALCDEGGELLYPVDKPEEMHGEISGPAADELLDQILELNGFHRFDATPAVPIADESGNSKPTENSAS